MSWLRWIGSMGAVGIALAGCAGSPRAAEQAWNSSCAVHRPCQRAPLAECSGPLEEGQLEGQLLEASQLTLLGCLDDGACCNAVSGGYNIHLDDGTQRVLRRGAVAAELACTGDDSRTCCSLAAERGDRVRIAGRPLTGLDFEVDSLCRVTTK